MRSILRILALISVLFVIQLSNTTGCSTKDKQIVLHYNDEYYDPTYPNRTVWEFDMTKSKLTDDYKTLYAQMPAQYTWLGISLDFTFFLTNGNKMGNDDKFRRGYVTVGGNNIIPMSWDLTSPNGTCEDFGGSIHQLHADLFPKEYTNRPVGVEIGFTSQDDVYSPKTGRNHEIQAKLRLMCATTQITEFQKIPLNFVDNPQMSWVGEKLVLVFSYWTAAGCGVPRPAPPLPRPPTPDYRLIEEFLAAVAKICFIFMLIFCANICGCALLILVPCCCCGAVAIGLVAVIMTIMAKRAKPQAYEGHVQLGKDTGSVPVQPALPITNY